MSPKSLKTNQVQPEVKDDLQLSICSGKRLSSEAPWAQPEGNTLDALVLESARYITTCFGMACCDPSSS